MSGSTGCNSASVLMPMLPPRASTWCFTAPTRHCLRASPARSCRHSIRYTYARSGHPALENWTQQAWIDWPHIIFGSTHGTPETVAERIAKLGVDRRIGARVTDYAHIGPLLAKTNMLANQVAVMLTDDLDHYSLRILRPPMELPDFTFRWVWSTRLTTDPGSRWFRTILMNCFDDLVTETAHRVERIGVVEPVRTGD